MKSDEKIKKLALALAEKTAKDKAAKDTILAEYKEKGKTKKLTTDERIARIERLIGIA